MAGDKSTFWEGQVIDFLFDTLDNAPIAPGTGALWVALLTTAPVNGSTGSTIIESSATWYDRIQRDPGSTNWNKATQSSQVLVFNTAQIQWPANQSGATVTLQGAALVSASAAGQVYYYDDFTNAVPILVNQQATIAANAIQITEQ